VARIPRGTRSVLRMEQHPDIPVLKEAKAEGAKLHLADTAPLRRLLFAWILLRARFALNCNFSVIP
jgi:hypothetical protein